MTLISSLDWKCTCVKIFLLFVVVIIWLIALIISPSRYIQSLILFLLPYLFLRCISSYLFTPPSLFLFAKQNVLDGDLCEQFNLLDSQKQTSIAEELNRSVGEVLKKLEDLRNRCL